MILEQPAGERFVMLALAHTDERVRAGKSISPGFLFATLLWHEVLVKWTPARARDEHRIPALNRAIDDVARRSDREARNPASLRRRHARDLGPAAALRAPRGRSAFRLLEHLRFRAGYDFLLLRCAADEVPAELADWWTRFAHAGAEERETRCRRRLATGARRGREEKGGGVRAAGARNASRSALTAAAARLDEACEAHRIHRARFEPGRNRRGTELGDRVAAFYRADRRGGGLAVLPLGSDRCTGADFLNAVAKVETALEPYALLLHLLDIELMLGRKRRGLKKNAPRNVDLDLLLVGDMIIQSTPLTLPHPRLHLRAFVLRPLLDLAPEIRIPGQGPAAAFLDAVEDQKVEPLEAPAAP